MNTRLERLTPEHAEALLPQLSELLIDAVEGGASVGFLPPLAEAEAREYWGGVITAMQSGSRILLAAFEGDLLQGSVQLGLEMRANGNHRGEVMKLFVHRRARHRGIARQLMAEVESTARTLGRTLLLLDTETGSDAERLYERLGWIRFGQVPRYARSAEDGSLHGTSFFYKEVI